jgi:hypothetical protein
MLLDKLEKRGLIHPPKWLANNTQLLVTMGSQAYGVSNDQSDLDVYGVCIPHKDVVFPHLAGEIPGFGRQLQRFDVWQEHHVIDPDKKAAVYDFQVYSIVRYFHLCMDNNPNMIDSLFVPRRCVIHSTYLGEHIRENRHLFLHKGAYHRFKGYAYAQMGKIKSKGRREIIESQEQFDMFPEDLSVGDHTQVPTKRELDIMKYGYDVKFSYHLVRLLNECEQLLVEGDLDLERNNEQLKSIRRGEWKLEDIENYFVAKERNLEKCYVESTLPQKPDEVKIKKLLMECLEMHYGSISVAVKNDGNHIIDEIVQILRKGGIV